MSLSNYVQIGAWVDWSHDPIRGATLTLTSRDGAILLSFLTLWVGLAGGFFWTIVAFVTHQLRAHSSQNSSDEDCQDGLWSQQQIILRDTRSPYLVAWHMARGWLIWRKAAHNAFARSMIPCLLALLVASLFSLAGILTSRAINATSNDVLIFSPNCGYMSADQIQNETSIETLGQKILNDTIAGSAYARACYENSSLTLQCGTFAQSRLNYTENQNASCPFASDMCVYGQTAALQFDTGHMDSLEAFGLNSPRDQRVSYRKVSTCTPLTVPDWAISETNENRTMFNTTWEEEFMYFWLGELLYENSTVNYTFVYGTHDVATIGQYTVQTYLGGPDSDWQPISQLNRTNDADPTIMAIASNAITYSAPVDDPLFAAHIEYGPGVFYSDNWMTFLACTDQHQFCFSKTAFPGDCTPLTSMDSATDAIDNIEKSDVQTQIAMRISTGLTFTEILYGAVGRGSSALRAQESIPWDGISRPLPRNQWMIECRSWFNTALAKLQRGIVDFATGPVSEDVLKYWITDSGDTPAWRRVCGSQRIKNPGNFQNFSIVGVGIILVIGSMIIFVGLFVDMIVGFVQKRFFPHAHGRLAWALDSKFQLQRMAFEGAGWNQWDFKTSEDAVPVARADARMGSYARIDGEWGTIARPRDEYLTMGATMVNVMGKMDGM